MSDAGIAYQKAKVLDIWKAGDPRGLDAWVEGLKAMDGEEVVLKQFPSAFFGTGLEKLLREKGVDTVVVCGVSTSGCVRATTLDALCHGFRP